MAVLVWATLGIALWHFTVFVPDRFRGGIVGGFLAATIGAIISGAIWQVITGESIGTTDVLTALAAIPGCLLAMAAIYAFGSTDEEHYGDA
jgi:hypothetical protein